MTVTARMPELVLHCAGRLVGVVLLWSLSSRLLLASKLETVTSKLLELVPVLFDIFSTMACVSAYAKPPSF